MSITVNGTTINSLNVGNTQVNKVLVRQNESSDYTIVYYTETYEENVTVSGKTRAAGLVDETGTTWYFTPNITHIITSPSGTVEVISAEAVSSSVYSVTINDAGTGIKVQLKGPSGNTTVDGTVKVKYAVCFSSFSNIPAYNVIQVSSTTSHQFKLNSTGYYESQCKGINNGWSLCKVEFNIAGNYTLQCISYGENGFDFGILSTINNTLDASNKVDSANVKKSFKGLASAAVQSVSYSGVKVGDYIYVKYRKDSSLNHDNDTLQFKVV